MRKFLVVLLIVLAGFIGKAALWPGPDGYGYSGADVAFNWVDITSTGTAITGLTDDNYLGAFNIGFTFPFYGANYTQFYIASNGYIQFGAGTSTLTDQCPLPNSSAPNNLIALMWDDLDAGDTSDVAYYQYFSSHASWGECCVVLYNNWHHYLSTPPGPIAGTWEVILQPSGTITIQYLDSGAENGLNSTAGIEGNNATGDYGLTYRCNTASSLSDNLAIEFAINSGDTCDESLGIALNSCQNGSTIGLGLDFSCNAPSTHMGPDLVYIFTLNAPASLTIIGEADYDADWAMSGLCDASSSTIFCLDSTIKPVSPSCSAVASPYASGDLTWSGSLASGTYYIWVDGKGATDAGDFSIEITGSLDGENCSNPILDTTGMSQAIDTMPPSQSSTAAGTTTGYINNGLDAAKDVVYEFTLTSSKYLEISLCGSTYDSRLYVDTLCPPASTHAPDYAYDDDSCLDPTTTASVIACREYHAGTWYVWIDGYSSASGDYQLTITECAGIAGETCYNTIPIECNDFASGTTVGFASDYSDAVDYHAPTACLVSDGMGADVVYEFTLDEPSECSVVTVELTGMTTDLDVWLTVDPLCGGTAMGSADDLLAMTNLPNGTYFIFIDSAAGEEGPYTLNLYCAPIPPGGDSCTDAIPLPCNSTLCNQTFNPACLNQDVAGTADCTTYAIAGDGDMFYTFTLTEMTDLSVAFDGKVGYAGYYHLNLVNSGICDGTLDSGDCLASVRFAWTGTISLIEVPAGTYYLWINAETATTGLMYFALNLTCTPTPTFTPPFFQSFESTVPPFNWSSQIIAGPNNWISGSTYESHGAGNARLSYNATQVVEARLVSPRIDMSAFSDYILSFWLYHRSDTTNVDTLTPEISVNGGPWISLTTIPIKNASSNYTHLRYYEIDLSAYSGPGFTSNKIALHGYMGVNGWWIDVDAFTVARPRSESFSPRINEALYDDLSTDDLQFIELYQAGGGFDLSDWRIVSWNGASGTLSTGYANGQITIPAGSILPTDGFYVIGNAAVANVDLAIAGTGADLWLENDNDSVQLQDPHGRPYDGLGWGSFGAYPLRNYGEGSPALDITETDIDSYQLCPDGDDTHSDLLDYLRLPMSPGETNAGCPTPISTSTPSGVTPTCCPLPTTGPVGTGLVLLILGGLLAVSTLRRK